MAGKPFSNKLYKEDDNAKDIVISWIQSMGWDAEVNPDQYGIDVIATDFDGEKHYFEVEVKHNWTGPRFPYDTLHYSARKLKFLTKPDNTAFVTLNHERTHALMALGEDLKDCPIITKDTVYTSNEKFIEIQASSCYPVEMSTK